MRWARWVLLAVMAVSCGRAPGYRTRAVGLAEAGKLDAAIEELRFHLARHPDDGAAHAALARLHDRAGRPGAALRHFELARPRDALARADRDRLSALYLERARARLELGDAGAIADFEAAEALRAGATRDEAALEGRLYRLGALAGMRAGDPESLRRARALLRRLARLQADDPRVALLGPDAAELSTLGIAARWLYDGGARRQGLLMLDRYVRAGGRARDVLERWLDAHRWWRGARSTLPEATVDAAARQGLDVCSIAYVPRDRDCATRVLGSDVLDDADAAARLWRRVRQLHWRTSEPRLAAALTSLALRAWVQGEVDSWLGALTEHVDVEALPATQWPIFAAATLARARGDAAAAATHLERALAGARALSPQQRAVVFCEAAVQGRSSGELTELALSGPVPEYAWVVGAAAARVAGARALELERLQQAGSHAFGYLVGHGELALLAARLGDRRIGLRYADAYARWYEVLEHPGLIAGRTEMLRRWSLDTDAPGAPASSFGTVDAYRVAAANGARDRAAADGLATIVAHYQRDPALADRTARDYSDGAVAAGERAPALVALWLGLGEAERAHAWALELLATSPRHPDYVLLAGEAAAAAGDLEQADVHFIAAAATSGDAGATNLAAARALLAQGHALAAIRAARRALELTAPGEEHAVLLTLARGMRALGRDADATAVLARFLERVPAPFRGGAVRDIRDAWGDGSLPGELATEPTLGRRAAALRGEGVAAEWTLDPADPDLALAYARTLADTDAAAARAALDEAIAWNTGHVGVRVARLALSPPDELRAQELVGELVAIAIAGDGDRRAAALVALVDVFEQRGARELAAAAGRASKRR